MSTSALILSLHLLSLHDAPGFEGVNPGVSIQHAETGYTAGVLRNSEGSTSVFAGRMFQTEDKRWAITVGLITGYRTAPVLPLVTPSVRFDLGSGWALRANWIPKVSSESANALHFNIEKSF